MPSRSTSRVWSRGSARVIVVAICNDFGNRIPYSDYLAAFSETRIPVRWPSAAPRRLSVGRLSFLSSRRIESIRGPSNSREGYCLQDRAYIAARLLTLHGRRTVARRSFFRASIGSSRGSSPRSPISPGPPTGSCDKRSTLGFDRTSRRRRCERKRGAVAFPPGMLADTRHLLQHCH